MMGQKLNPVMLIGTGLGVVLISLYVNYASYKDLWLGKMMIFAVFGALMFLYGGIRYLIEKPAKQEHPKPHKPQAIHHARQQQTVRSHHYKPHVNPNNCTGCGSHLTARARFCEGCGRKLH
jgi:ABC-type nickel/cobalt efflux system permease component RcnA